MLRYMEAFKHAPCGQTFYHHSASTTSGIGISASEIPWVSVGTSWFLFSTRILGYVLVYQF